MKPHISFELAKDWFHGAIIAEVAVASAVLGLCLQRRAHLRAVKPDAGQQKTGRGISFPGAVLLFLALVLESLARFWTPGITVECLFVIGLFLNFAISSAILSEQYRLFDVMASVISAMFAFLSFTAQIVTHRVPRPSDKLLVGDSLLITSNWGFMAYAICWLTIVLFCLAVNTVACFTLRTRDTAGLCRCVQRFTMPVAGGFFSALASNFLCVGVSIMTNTGHLELGAGPELTWRMSGADWSKKNAISANFILLLAMLCAAVAWVHVLVGTSVFECRYFTATSEVCVMVTMSVADLLLSRTWVHMSTLSIIYYALATLLSVIAVFMISSTETAFLAALSTESELPACVSGEPAGSAIQVVSVSPGPETHAITSTWWYPWWFFVGRCLPFSMVMLIPVLYCIVLFMPWHSFATWVAFTVLTYYSIWQAYQYCFQLFIFSISGQRKIDMSMAIDFQSRYEEEKVNQALENGSSGLKWEDVLHVVIIANYKEHLHILREAVETVAASPMAAKQITLVLAMEAREEGSKEKSEELIREFSGRFRHIFATFHPDGIPNEIKGKASNIHWAFDQITKYIANQPDVSEHQVLVTVGDADSLFHYKYFLALTEAFLSAGLEREENIWQPPMLHLKNYHEQPAPIRLSSLFTSTHELANLADPYATALPYSTYSVPMRLLQAVGDFDPDWLSEDWHIGLKCGLATMGRCRVKGIFLPVLNYAPEDDTYCETLAARWQQAKRHALGFTEIAYIWGSLPLALNSQGAHHRKWHQAIRFISRAMLPLSLKVVSVHFATASLWSLPPLNGFMMYRFWNEKMTDYIGSWTFLLNATSSLLYVVSTAGVLLANVSYYEQTKPRITPPAQGQGFWWRYPALHFIRLCVFEATICGFLFYTVAGFAAWIAAVKSIFSYKFTHDVALKPAADRQQQAEHQYTALLEEDQVMKGE